MKLTNKSLKAINNKKTRILLALALAKTEGWIITLIGQNKDNGPLTTAAALKVIKQETGLEDSELLEEGLQEVGAAR